MKKKQQGFTIVELLVATTVFSVVMVICLAAFLRVGQLYYKGIYLARTQEITRNISDDIVGQLRLNGGFPTLAAGGTIIGPSGSSYNVYYMCAGTKRYSFMSDNVVNSQTENTTNNFGLVRDNMPSACVSPNTSPLVSPIELLSDNMRVVATGTGPNQSDFNSTCITTSSNTICSIHVHVDFGGDDLLMDSATNNDFTNAANAVAAGSCSGPLQGSQFCATSDLDTTVYPLQ